MKILSSLPQCAVEVMICIFPFPKGSCSQSQSMSIYDAESMQSLSYSMTLDSYEPYLIEKSCQSLQQYS